MARYRKSPIYRVGNKYRNLGKIIPLFPKDINNFYDVFGGSGVVAINAKANKKFYNENDINICRQMNFLKKENTIKLKKEMLALQKKEEEQEKVYNELREKYNGLDKKSREAQLILYTLTFGSFSNMYGFNKEGDFNIPKRNKWANLAKVDCDLIKELEITNLDFQEFLSKNIENSTSEDFFFFDPPYINVANKKGGTNTNDRAYNGYTLEQEQELLKFCQKLVDKKINFMITNTLRNKGNENELLINFIKKNKLNTKILNETNNANGITNVDYLEVAIFNYEPEFMQTNLF